MFKWRFLCIHWVLELGMLQGEVQYSIFIFISNIWRENVFGPRCSEYGFCMFSTPFINNVKTNN